MSSEPGGRSQRDIVVIGASAGGVEAMTSLFAGLPQELPAAVFVVLHMMPGGSSVLPKILGRASRMKIAAASDDEPIERGRVYVAPPDHHMLLEEERVRLTAGPRENGHRPAIDPLFRSAARAYERRVIGVILSGSLDDGSAGLKMIAEMGGTALVQAPDTALYPNMPEAALSYAPGARAVPITGLADAICTAVESRAADAVPVSAQASKSVPTEQQDRSDDDPRDGVLTPLTCPECGGTLWEHDEEGGLTRFKCHVGHAYSPDSLDVSQAQSLESALWAALRSLQERADLLRRMARRIGGGAGLEAKAQALDEHARVLRSLVAAFTREAAEATEAEGRSG